MTTVNKPREEGRQRKPPVDVSLTTRIPLSLNCQRYCQNWVKPRPRDADPEVMTACLHPWHTRVRKGLCITSSYPDTHRHPRMTCTFTSKLNSYGSVFKTNHYFPKLGTELLKEAAHRVPESCGILQAGACHMLQGDWDSNTWGASKRVNGGWILTKIHFLKKTDTSFVKVPFDHYNLWFKPLVSPAKYGLLMTHHHGTRNGLVDKLNNGTTFRSFL